MYNIKLNPRFSNDSEWLPFDSAASALVDNIGSLRVRYIHHRVVQGAKPRTLRLRLQFLWKRLQLNLKLLNNTSFFFSSRTYKKNCFQFCTLLPAIDFINIWTFEYFLLSLDKSIKYIYKVHAQSTVCHVENKKNKNLMTFCVCINESH